MKQFHISDVLSVTTGRLVSTRDMDGVYDMLNFLTGDNLFTHQLPRAMDECRPWLQTQFPALMEDAPGMSERLADMDRRTSSVPQTQASLSAVIDAWVEELRRDLGLPETLPVYEMGADMHTRIDPIEEARAMFGDKRVIAITDEDVEGIGPPPKP